MTDEKSVGQAPSPKRKTLRVSGLVLIISALFLVITLSLFVPMMAAKSDREAIIKIPESATTDMVADSLTKYFGESYARKVIRINKLHKADFSKRHGAYLIPEGTSAFITARRLHRGAQHPMKITINGFRTMPLMASRIAAKLDFSKEELMKTLSDSAILAPYGLTPSQAMALFLDDTYEFYWTATPEEVVKKIGENYHHVWTPTRRRKAMELGLSPADVVTLASIVDEETNKADEKGKIGRLYINRLHKGMRLQADPTVRYAVGDFTIHRVNSTHLKTNSPYNTYQVTGLPPGPIRTTSKSTIDAVLNSEPSNDIYMCAREDFSGYHNFSSEYREHVSNALRYQHALDLRGIK